LAWAASAAPDALDGSGSDEKLAPSDAAEWGRAELNA